MFGNSNYTLSDSKIQADREPQPYSTAWFRELQRLNPIGAMLSVHVFRSTRSFASCCICGDLDPDAATQDYQWNGAGLILRLCSDCRGLQELLDGAELGTLVRCRNRSLSGGRA